MVSPLQIMRLRSADIDPTLDLASSPLGGSFGLVRKLGHKPHQGWDLLAAVGTPVRAIADGEIVGVTALGDYGLQILLSVTNPHQPPATVYAFYAHLSLASVKQGESVEEGQVIGLTGRSGNALHTSPHLHFEIRTFPWPGKGLPGRIDPGQILGYQYYSCSA